MKRKPWRQLPWRTRRAMAARWLSGQLSRIRTMQKTYRMEFDDVTGEFRTGDARKTRLPCRLSTRLLTWSMDHDREHHDHWGIVHRSTEKFMYACPVCGGGVELFPRGPGLRNEDD